MDDDVIKFDPKKHDGSMEASLQSVDLDTFTADKAIEQAIKAGLSEIIIYGLNKEGKFFTTACCSRAETALWLVEKGLWMLKHQTL